MKRAVFKKMVALGAGLTMVGATVFGAMAADLNQYPSPLFIQDGQFNAYIVVGTVAATSDVVGSIEMAASLQTAAVKKTIVASSTGGTATASDGYKLRKTGREVTYNSTLRSVLGAPISFTELPTLLAKGTFDDSEGTNKQKETYTQELDFVDRAGAGQYTFKAAEDVKNDAAAGYFWFDDTSGTAPTHMYVYSLVFDTPITYDNTSNTNAADDLEDNTLMMQGNTYTISDVGTLSSGRLNKIELLAGETVVWMTQNEPLTKTIAGTDHVVTLVDVNEDANKCGITIDGTMIWIDKGQTKTVNGVQLGVTDAIVTHSAGKDTDVCKVNVGATKLTLEQNKKVKKDDKEVDGSNFMFKYSTSGTNQRWDGFNITYTPKDEIYLSPGESTSDPVLGNFKFTFASVSASYEEMTWKGSGSGATFEFNNYEGKPIKIQWKLNTTNNGVSLGKSLTERLFQEGETYLCGTNEESCEDHQLLVVTSGNVIHIVEITDVDTANSQIDLRDVTYGVDYTDKPFTANTAGGYSISLGSIGTIALNITTNGKIEVNDVSLGGAAYTQSRATLGFNSGFRVFTTEAGVVNNTFGNATVNIAEYTGENLDGKSVGSNVNITLRFGDSDNDDKIELEADPSIVATSANSWVTNSSIDKNEDTSDVKYFATEWGSILEYDASSTNNDRDRVLLKIPQEQAYANVFLTPLTATISTTSGGVETLELQPIQVGSAKLDTEVADVTAQNLIVVGGPCANSVAATLLGNKATCGEGFVDGEAMIKLFSHANGKTALLVAGYSALDTRRATRVLANYKDYASSLKGMEVKVKGTTLTDIRVESVA